MKVGITIRVTSSGRTLVEIGESVVLPVEERPTKLSHKGVFYHEPLETASRAFETRFGKESTEYVVSPSTG